MKVMASDLPSPVPLRDIILDPSRDMPLHAQLRTALERIIDEHFEDQNWFFSESQLISELKVSQGTVRRALTDLANLGFIEKRPARGTVVHKNSRSAGLHNLAVFLPDYSSATVARFLTLLNAECHDRNIALQPIYTHQGERLLKAYSHLKFKPNQGGVVLLENSPRATIELTSVLEEKNYNYVIIGTLLRNTSHKFVGGCNDTIMEIGLDYLIKLGHKRIALLVSEPEEKENVRERVAAFRKYAAKYNGGVDARVISCHTKLWEDAHDQVDSVLTEQMEGQKPPTAIFGISDAGALAAMKWLQKRNYRIPEDVSVMGSDGIEAGTLIHPSLTTMKHPHEDMTKKVFELLEATDLAEPKQFLKPTLDVRESTAPPPEA